MRSPLSLTVGVLSIALAPLPAQQTSPLKPDIPPRFEAPTGANDYVKRDVMIPMRDGVRLHTVIVVPNGARNAPILLTRTPYNASTRSQRNRSPHIVAALPLSDEVFAADGYIRVYQDVRGKYGSEGEYVMTRPLRGPLNNSTVDHSTDAYDTIDWLVKNLPESNRRHGARESASGAEGGGAGEPDGRRLDG
jgi:predicted acyl esterase